MLKLFAKSKVKQGKQTVAAKTAADKAGADDKKDKKVVGLAGFAKTWKKLNSMDRKQAYTWGAVVLVAIIGLIILASAASSDNDDFAEFETRGYDLANMPFSSDEAEQYLLASKYPDMKEDAGKGGLYSEEEREEREAADAEAAEAVSGGASSGYRGRSYGGRRAGRGGTGARTAVGSLGNASATSARGSGMGGTFGPRGDFSSFKSQNKGRDTLPTANKSGDARTALRQLTRSSRAAAGLKNNKLENTKKALMGAAVEGEKAFDESGAVNLADAQGLELDTNAPGSSADLSGLDKGLDNAHKNASDKAQQKDQDKWWKDMLVDILKKVVDMGLKFAGDAINNSIAASTAAKADASKAYQKELDNHDIPAEAAKVGRDGKLSEGSLNTAVSTNSLPSEYKVQDAPVAEQSPSPDTPVANPVSSQDTPVTNPSSSPETSVHADSDSPASKGEGTSSPKKAPLRQIVNDKTGEIIATEVAKDQWQYEDGKKITIPKEERKAWNKQARENYNTKYGSQLAEAERVKKETYDRSLSEHFADRYNHSSKSSGGGNNGNGYREIKIGGEPYEGYVDGDKMYNSRSHGKDDAPIAWRVNGKWQNTAPSDGK